MLKVVVAGAAPVPLRVTMQLQSLRQTVNVNDAGPYVTPGASSSTNLDVPLMELPLSVHVIPAAVLQDQQVTSLQSAIQNISGVIVNNDGHGTGDSFAIRGFDQNELTYEDGLRVNQDINGGFARDMANVEQVEVIKGPDAVIYGQSEPGSLVNVVIKKPLDTPYFSLQQQFAYGTNHTRRLRSVVAGRYAVRMRSAQFFLLITYREIRYTHVGFQMGKDTPEKTEVLQGTLILLVLRTLEALGPLHGYGIARRIEQISRDLLQMNQGTLYPALLRMEQEGWITSRWGASEKNRKAKLYSISAAGRRQLAKETLDWQRMSSTINRFLGPVPNSLAKDLL